MTKKRIQAGVIIRAAGIKGDIWVKSLTSPAEHLFTLTPLYDEAGDRQFKLKLQYHKKGATRCFCADITNRNEAESLVGTKLYVDGDAKTLEPKAHPYIDMQVKRADGAMAGVITHVQNYGASDILVIENDAGSEFMVASHDNFIQKVDSKNNIILLHENADAFFQLDNHTKNQDEDD